MTKKKKDTDIEFVKKTANKILSLMGTNAEANVAEDKENEAYIVDIDTEEEAGLLIGKKGETINALQMILGMIYRQKNQEWKRIMVNVADWRSKQEDRLNDMAVQAAERARETGQPQHLYNLTPSQRRIIHLNLSEVEDIETESAGEGRDRYLVVKPKEEE